VSLLQLLRLLLMLLLELLGSRLGSLLLRIPLVLLILLLLEFLAFPVLLRIHLFLLFLVFLVKLHISGVWRRSTLGRWNIFRVDKISGTRSITFRSRRIARCSHRAAICWRVVGGSGLFCRNDMSAKITWLLGGSNWGPALIDRGS
jgi:hypothetical protein